MQSTTSNARIALLEEIDKRSDEELFRFIFRTKISENVIEKLKHDKVRDTIRDVMYYFKEELLDGIKEFKDPDGNLDASSFLQNYSLTLCQISHCAIFPSEWGIVGKQIREQPDEEGLGRILIVTAYLNKRLVFWNMKNNIRDFHLKPVFPTDYDSPAYRCAFDNAHRFFRKCMEALVEMMNVTRNYEHIKIKWVIEEAWPRGTELAYDMRMKFETVEPCLIPPRLTSVNRLSSSHHFNQYPEVSRTAPESMDFSYNTEYRSEIPSQSQHFSPPVQATSRAGNVVPRDQWQSTEMTEQPVHQRPSTSSSRPSDVFSARHPISKSSSMTLSNRKEFEGRRSLDSHTPYSTTAYPTTSSFDEFNLPSTSGTRQSTSSDSSSSTDYSSPDMLSRIGTPAPLSGQVDIPSFSRLLSSMTSQSRIEQREPARMRRTERLFPEKQIEMSPGVPEVGTPLQLIGLQIDTESLLSHLVEAPATPTLLSGVKRRQTVDSAEPPPARRNSSRPSQGQPDPMTYRLLQPDEDVPEMLRLMCRHDDDSDRIWHELEDARKLEKEIFGRFGNKVSGNKSEKELISKLVANYAKIDVEKPLKTHHMDRSHATPVELSNVIDFVKNLMQQFFLAPENKDNCSIYDNRQIVPTDWKEFNWGLLKEPIHIKRKHLVRNAPSLKWTKQIRGSDDVFVTNLQHSLYALSKKIMADIIRTYLVVKVDHLGNFHFFCDGTRDKP